MTDPLIGIVFDHHRGGDGAYSTRPHYALRTDYFEAVRMAGGEPVGLDHAGSAARKLDRLDGYLTPGGEFASPAAWYLDPAVAGPYEPSPRLDIDLALVGTALDRKMPVLGMCAGMQLMAGMRGARLVPDVTRHFNSAVQHKFSPREALAHTVDIVPGTRLRDILGTDRLQVNSNHREAVAEPGPDVIVAARSPDGVIEAIELRGNFALGVQWHPELAAPDDLSRRIFTAFVDEARRFRFDRV